MSAEDLRDRVVELLDRDDGKVSVTVDNVGLSIGLTATESAIVAAASSLLGMRFLVHTTMRDEPVWIIATPTTSVRGENGSSDGWPVMRVLYSNTSSSTGQAGGGGHFQPLVVVTDNSIYCASGGSACDDVVCLSSNGSGTGSEHSGVAGL